MHILKDYFIAHWNPLIPIPLVAIPSSGLHSPHNIGSKYYHVTQLSEYGGLGAGDRVCKNRETLMPWPKSSVEFSVQAYGFKFNSVHFFETNIVARCVTFHDVVTKAFLFIDLLRDMLCYR